MLLFRSISFSRGKGPIFCGAMTVLLAVNLAVAPPAFGTTNKADWITHADDYLVNHMNKVQAIMWFNNYKPGMSEPDWRIDSDPKAIAAYATAWPSGGGPQPGVFIDGAPPTMSKITDFENLIGTGNLKPGHQDRIGWFQCLSDDFPTQSVKDVFGHGTGSTPYIVWQLYDTDKGDTDARNGTSRLGELAGGSYDSLIADWASELKDLAFFYPGKRIQISIGHEMNGNWFTWGIGYPGSGNTAAAYVNAYKHMVNEFADEGVTNVDWVWCVNASANDDFSAAFPGITDLATGHTLVNWTGMNGFNWGKQWRNYSNAPPWPWDDWRELEEIFGPWQPGGFSTYNKLVQLGDLGGGNCLPIVVGEFGSNFPEPATVALLALGSLALMPRRRG